MVRRLSRRAGRGWEDLPKGREWLGDALEGREGSGGPGVVGQPSRKTDRGRAASRVPKRVGRPSWWAGRGQDTLPKGQEESGGPLRGLVGVGKPARRAGRGQKALLQDYLGVGSPSQRTGRGW